MKNFQNLIVCFVSAVFCSALTFSLNARASSEELADAPAEYFSYQVILSDYFTDAPESLPETTSSPTADDFTDAPQELPEDFFLVSDSFADAPENLPVISHISTEVPYETVFPIETNTSEIMYETPTAPETDPVEIIPVETIPPETESADPPEETAPEIPSPPEENSEIVLPEQTQIPETLPELIMDAPEDAPVTVDFDTPENIPIKTDDIPSEYAGGYEDFLSVLGGGESSNNYYARNSWGYLGRFQMGSLALQDVGLKDASGNWTALAHEQFNIDSDDDFLASPKAQDYAILEMLLRNWRTLKRKGAENHIGESVRGIKITKSGLLGAAHLVGANGAADIFQNLDRADANQTSMYEYLSLMGGYYLDYVIP